jgi:hypothetical protein
MRQREMRGRAAAGHLAESAGGKVVAADRQLRGAWRRSGRFVSLPLVACKGGATASAQVVFEVASDDEHDGESKNKGCRYWPWAGPMARTFQVDVTVCPTCGGRLELVALVQEKEGGARFLRREALVAERLPHLGLLEAHERLADVVERRRDLVLAPLDHSGTPDANVSCNSTEALWACATGWQFVGGADGPQLSWLLSLAWAPPSLHPARCVSADAFLTTRALDSTAAFDCLP